MSDLATLGMHFETVGAEQANRQLDAVAQNAAKAEQATDGMSGANRRATGAIAGLIASIDKSLKQLVDMQRLQQQAAGATASHTAATSALTAELTQATTAMSFYGASFKTTQTTMGGAAAAASQYVAATKSVSTATAQMSTNVVAVRERLKETNEVLPKTGKAAGLAANEMLNLSRQAADVGVSLASGMPLFLVAIQQGAQIGDVFQQASTRGVGFSAALGSIGESVGGLAMRFLPLGIAITAATVAAAPFVQKMNEVNEQAGTLKNFGAVLKTLGDVSKYSASDLAAISDRLQDVGYKAGEANQVLAQMVREGVSSAYLERFGVTARNVSQVLQMDLAKASELVSQGFTQNASDILKLDTQLGFLSATERAHIIELQKSKNEAEARTEAFAIFEKRYAAAAQQMAGPWTQILKNFDGAWRDFGDFLTAGIDWEKLRGEIGSIIGLIQQLTAALPGATSAAATVHLRKQVAETDQNIAWLEGRLRTQQGLGNNAWAANIERDLLAQRWRKVELEGQIRKNTYVPPVTTPAAAGTSDTTYRPPAYDGRAERPKVDRHAESLARELEALKETAAANYALAEAYGVSDAAAQKAAARADAVGRAIKRQGDQDAFVAAQLELNASKAAVTGAQQLADLMRTTEYRKQLNGEVAAGTMTAQQANEALAIEAAIRPLIAAAAGVEGDAKTTLLELAQKLTGVLKEENEVARESQRIAERRGAANQLKTIQTEIGLIGAGNRERAVALAQLAEEQRLIAAGETQGSDYWNERMAGAAAYANAQTDLAEGTLRYNDQLREQLDLLQQIDDHARDAAQGLSDVFSDLADGIGDGLDDYKARLTGFADALGGVLTTMTGYRAEIAAINEAQRAYVEKGGKDEDRLAMFARDRAQAEIQSYGDMAAAAKGFFDERSKGYQIAQAAEMAFRAVEFGLAARAMVVNAMEGNSKIAQSARNAAAYASEAVANAYRSIPFPFNLAAAAAVVAGLAAMGVKLLGGGGGSSASYTPPPTNVGAGTVLGAPDEVSQSLAKSLDRAEKYQDRDLAFSSEMVSALRAIQDGIGAVTAEIGKQLGVGGSLNTDSLGLGQSAKSSFFGLFKSSSSTELLDQGLRLQAQTLGQILVNGIAGQIYNTTQTTKTKSGFFGIGGGTKISQSETFTGMDAELSRQMTALLGSLRNGVLTAAGQLGIEGAAAVLDSFQVNIGRISFKGMSSDQIAETLNNVFSAIGDQMATAVVPQLLRFQQAGEGMFETLARLVAEYQLVDSVMASMGRSFGLVGMGSIEARDRLVRLAGGLDEFKDSAAFFVSEFLTEAQQIAPIQAAVTAELQRLGIATDISREQFASLVMGLDVSTEAGAQMYAALMALAPALDKTLDYTEELTGSVSNAAELDRQRRELEIALMEAQGRISDALAARRADELAAMDASLRPMQEAVWAAQDMAQASSELARTQTEAAEKIAALASQRRDMEIQLLEAQGRSTEALAAKRELELAALDATLRPLQLAIYAALDLASANETLSEAQAEAAAASEQAAERARQLAETRRTMDIDLMDALGQSVEALAARRQMELEQLDPSLRALQNQIYAAQDAAAANQQLADAQQAAADKAAQLASQQQDLQLRLLEAQGNSTGALALRRQQELANTDESLRALLQSIYAAEDAAAQAELAQQAAEARRQAAEERRQAAEQRIENARSALSQAYEREAGALQQTIDKFAGFSESLRAFRADLEGANASSAMFARAEFERVSALARLGNEEALGSLQGVSQAYLDAAQGSASTAADYQRAVSQVMSAVDAAIGTSDRQKTLAEQQLDALKAQVRGIVDLNESVLSVADAIREFLVAGGRRSVTQFAEGGVFTSPTMFTMGDRLGRMAEDGPEAIMPLVQTPGGLGVRSVSDDGEAAGEIRALRAEVAELRAAMIQTAVNTGQIKRQGDRAEQEGVYVRGEAPGDRVEVIAA